MLFLESESNVMLDLIRTVLLSICNVIYKLIIVMYELFMAIGDATILNSSGVQVIYNRVGLILGIIMMFRLVLSFVQYLLNPDKISDKDSGVGSLIKKVIVVILALGLTSWVFEKAFQLQSLILSENVIGKIVLGVDSNQDIDMEQYGVMFSYSLFSNFFRINPELDTKDDSQLNGCGEKYFNETMWNYVATYKDIEYAHKCVNEHGSVLKNHALSGEKEYYAEFDGLIALLVGGFVLWVLLMYTITLAVRVVKLAFLRIIAPIPILSYLSPKKSNGFSNWLKQCATTYLDLFIRIAIIYFAMLLISIILDPDQGALLGTSSSFLSSNSKLAIAFQVLLVLGVLLFAKKVPELLSDLFPSMGGKGGLDFGIGFKGREMFGKGLTATGGMVAGGAVGLVGGFAGGKGLSRFTGALGGLTTGVGRGIGSGISGKGASFGDIRKGISDVRKKQAEAELKRAQNIYAGYGLGDRIADNMRGSFGAMSPYELLEGEYSSYKDIKSDIDDDDGVKAAEFAKQQAYNDYVQNQNGTATFEEWSKNEGQRFSETVDRNRQRAWNEKMDSDKAFQAKVARHNKRFKTDYGMDADGVEYDDSNYKSFNNRRKDVKEKFEVASARKPRK